MTPASMHQVRPCTVGRDGRFWTVDGVEVVTDGRLTLQPFTLYVRSKADARREAKAMDRQNAFELRTLTEARS